MRRGALFVLLFLVALVTARGGAAQTPDLSIAKTDGGASVAPGGTVAYTLIYANSGSITATGVVLAETVPANSNFNAGASTAGWVCTPNNNAGSSCTLAVGSLAAGGGSQTATFSVTVRNPLPAGVTQIANTASIADDGTHGADPTPGNNSGSDTTPIVGAPDLSITKSDGGASVAPGGTVSYTLTYANSGNRGASGVVLTETVPANSNFNAGASTAGWVCVPNSNAGSTCTLFVGPADAGGGNQTATFAVTAVNPVPPGVTQIANTASISDDGTNGTDPTPGNNSGSDTTPFAGPPDHFAVGVPVSTMAGSPFSFTVTAQDAFGNTATGYAGTVHFTKSDLGAGSALPADYTFVAGDAGSHTFANGATLVTAGQEAITATDTVTAGMTGTSGSIAVSPAAATHFSVSAPGSAVMAIPFSFTVAAKDPFGNTDPTYPGTVHFTSTDPNPTLPGDGTLTNGTQTFSATLFTPGDQTITATDTVTSTITGTSGTISTVVPVELYRFTSE